MEELHRLIDSSRLFEDLSIFFYYGVARDDDRVLKSVCNVERFRFRESFRQRGGVGVSDRLLVDRAWVDFVSEPEDIERSLSRLRFGRQNNSHEIDVTARNRLSCS